MIRERKIAGGLALIGLLAFAGSGMSQTLWQGAVGSTQSWHTASNWSLGVPGVFQVAAVNNDGICEISATNNAVALNLDIGNSAGGTATGEVRIISQPLDLGFLLFVGFANNGGNGGGRLLGTNATIDVDALVVGQSIAASVSNGELRLTNSTVRTASLGIGNAVSSVSGVVSATGVASFSGGQSAVTNVSFGTVDVLVGSATAGAPMCQANASGTLSFPGNRIGPMGQMSAGLSACSAGQSSATGNGSIFISGTTVFPSATADATLRIGVGVATGDNTSSIADGQVVASFTGFQGFDEVVVGGSSGSGSAFSVSSTGTLTLNSSSLNAGGLGVGTVSTVVDPTATVTAFGSLQLTDSTLNVLELMAVGTYFPIDTPSFGSPSGSVSLVRSSIDVEGELVMGSNSVLRLQIDGPARGTQYAAIDAGSATIEGDIEVVFTSPPTAGTLYRLIMVDATGTLEYVESRLKFIGADPNTFLWSKGVNSAGEHIFWAGIPNPPRISSINVENDTNVVLTIDGLVPDLDYRIQRKVDPLVELWPEIANPVTFGSSHTTTTTVEQTPPVPMLRIVYP